MGSLLADFIIFFLILHFGTWVWDKRGIGVFLCNQKNSVVTEKRNIVEALSCILEFIASG
jgi:hypothetical protein